MFLHTRLSVTKKLTLLQSKKHAHFVLITSAKSFLPPVDALQKSLEQHGELHRFVKFQQGHKKYTFMAQVSLC